MKEFIYDAIAFKQTDDSDWNISFSANALEISNWAGIPQKKNFDSVESSGFQRTIKLERMNSLISFYSEQKNIIQNPLLCASRNSSDQNKPGVFFTADSNQTGEYSRKGKVKIMVEDYSSMTLKETLVMFKESLELRVPELAESELDQSLLNEIKKTFFEDDSYVKSDDLSSEALVELESSHIADLWQETQCRIETLNEAETEPDSILGFDKEALISYLLPATMVDGQHRLKGAIAQFETMRDKPELMEEVENYILSGKSPVEAQALIEDKYIRKLPVSLILSDDPAEHVFQFVVVNQKATPINTALLGTIVSTTLSSDELERVSHRLKNADIPLEDSQAVSFATRDRRSPFFNLVQTGITGENGGKIPWTVMKTIVSMFKDLKGAKFYSDTVKTDFADLWKRRLLLSSNIVEGDDLEEKMKHWCSDDGAWKEVFLVFWCKIRDEFGSIDDDGRQNYWGHTNSNLFNKISLTILATDYFKYLSSARVKLNSIDDVESSITEWLIDVDRTYFDRDWVLKNTKKDSPGIRKQWSSLWMNYREDPRKLPSVSQYRISFGG
ncbi:hypothetical protein [Enterovibrio norvegicus]|uniref:DGQHR domain-containing protein n=1 Tax=Enterovibrio norvegicus DSM 15893 TaxID=1121869 RepID=A0A1I5TDT7_9GAMM|nr:hypothetical protein [Enterovibrio norvegicus]SFP81215.1 hypothetical protein SAMN03084138_03196 [Enterovibrio norvegicus DSM 15893]